MSLNRLYFFSSLGVAAVTVALCPHVSMAQPRSTDDLLAFQKHDIDFNSPVGVPLGGFFLTPGFSYTGVYDDNIFRKDQNLTDDFINIFKPGLGIQTNWARHEVFVGLQATKTDYRWNSQKDALDYGAIVSGQYDITYGTYVDGYIKKNQSNLNRGSDDDIDGDAPIKYNSWSSRIGFTRALSYIQTKLAAFHENTERDDDISTAVAGDFLKRDKNGAEATLIYEFFPKNNLFVTLGHTNIDFNIVGSDTRIVNKSELKYGTNFSYHDMYTGSLNFGHLRTSYSHIPETSNDPYLSFNLNWAATPLTNVSFSAGRTYQDGNLSANEKVIVDTSRVGVSHQFTEFVTGNLTGSMAENSYRSPNGTSLRDNKVYAIGTDAQYQVSDHLGLKLGYDYKHRNSDTVGDDYKNNRVLFTLTYMH